MRNTKAVLNGDFVGDDVETLVDLYFIGVDDFGMEACSKINGDLRFSAPCCSHYYKNLVLFMVVDAGGGGGGGVRIHTDSSWWWAGLIEGFRNGNGVEWLDFMGSVMGLNSTLWEGKFHRQRKNREIERVRGTDSWLSGYVFC